MAFPKGEVVLITGSSGFLAGHLLHLLRKEYSVTEIRKLDKILVNNLVVDRDNESAHQQTEYFYQRDLLDLESCREIVRNVDVVFHCAASVSCEFPPDVKDLEDNNIQATKNLIRLCQEEGVARLIHCSTTAVNLRPYFKCGFAALVLYRGESMDENEDKNESRLIFGDYARSKLRAEKLILAANGLLSSNAGGKMCTISLRFPVLYGEGDTKLIATVLKNAVRSGHILPRISGKQQFMYAGNAAWALICANNALQQKSRAIGGLPVIVTDDTPLIGLSRFCENVSRASGSRHIKLLSCPLSTILTYGISFLLEICAKWGILSKLPVSPCALVAYSSSVLLYDRTRAAVRLDYTPLFSAEESFEKSLTYYSEILKSK